MRTALSPRTSCASWLIFPETVPVWSWSPPSQRTSRAKGRKAMPCSLFLVIAACIARWTWMGTVTPGASPRAWRAPKPEMMTSTMTMFAPSPMASSARSTIRSARVVMFTA